MSDAAVALEPSRPPVVRAPRPEDEKELSLLFEEAFGYRRPPEVRQWRYDRSPRGGSSFLVLDAGGVPVGNLGIVRDPAFLDGRPVSLGQLGDAIVAPAWRGRGALSLMIDTHLDRGPQDEMRLSFPNEMGLARALAHGRSGPLLGQVPVWIRRYGLRRPLPPLARSAARTLLRANGALAARRRPRLEVVELSDPGSEVDELAAASADFARCIRIRDAAYLRWRWLDQPDAAWRLLAVPLPGGRLGGIAVVGVTPDDVGLSGVVADLLARDAASTAALLCRAADVLVAAGCHVISCACLDPRPWSRRAFLRAGYWPGSTDFDFVATAQGDSPVAVVENRGSWYLTGADTEPWRNHRV